MQFGNYLPKKSKRIAHMNEARLETSLKRPLSDVERAAISKVFQQLPLDPRKRKRVLRTVQSGARKAELRALVGRRFMEPAALEIREVKCLLSNWQSSEHFIQEVSRFAALVPSEKLFGNRYKFLREAITVAELCRHTAVNSVRLGGDPPDAWVRNALNDEQPIEITEVLAQNRRRGDEYRSLGVQVGAYVSTADAPARIDQIVSQLRDAVTAKANKNYDAKPTLLIYLNIAHHERDELKIADAAKDLRSEFAQNLADIRIVTDRKLLF
jgi:hypothetical protein